MCELQCSYLNSLGYVSLKRAAEDTEGWRHRKNDKNLLYSRKLLITTITTTTTTAAAAAAAAIAYAYLSAR